MTAIEKVAFIYESRYAELNDWEKTFVSEIYENAQDEEELTRRQQGKINEIWEGLGL